MLLLYLKLTNKDKVSPSSFKPFLLQMTLTISWNLLCRPNLFHPVLGAGAGQAWAAAQAGGLPVPVGEPGGGPGEGCEGAERPGGAAHPGTQWGREGQESSRAGAQRADTAAQGGAKHCESRGWIFSPLNCILFCCMSLVHRPPPPSNW